MDADSVDGDGERPAVTACSVSLSVLRFDEKSRENIEEQGRTSQSKLKPVFDLRHPTEKGIIPNLGIWFGKGMAI